MGKIDQKKEEKRKALLNTAFDLFTIKGFSQTSIADIVDKAGVAKGTFYLYFKDKTDIRNRLIAVKATQIFKEAYEAMINNRPDTFEDQIIYIINHIVDKFEQDKTLLIFISKHLSWGIFKNALIEDRNGNDTLVYQIYKDFMNSSGYHFKDDELMVYLIIELVSGASYNPILYNQPKSMNEIKPFLYESIRNIIRQFVL